MGRTNIRDAIGGMIKDRASQTKAALFSNPKTLSFLKATNHDPSTPPSFRHVAKLLSAGNGSRAAASAAVDAVVDRLQNTRDACVAVKCLIVVHSIVKHGGFILLDQLSVYPAAAGRNYLKLSDFRDRKSPTMWQLSSWVQWYALYLEHLLSTSKVLGFFLSSTSRASGKVKEAETVSSLTNANLLNQLDVLITLLEQACKFPGLPLPEGRNLVVEVTQLVGEDYLSAVDEISVRVNEFRERRPSFLSFGVLVQLVRVLRRLEGCKERLFELCHRKRILINGFWKSIREVKGMVGSYGIVEGQSGDILVKRDRMSESVRFHDRAIPFHVDSFRSSSAR